MVNLTALQNLPTLTFNTTNLTNSTTLVPSIINTTDSVSGGFFGLSVMTGIFFITFFFSFKQDGDIRMDFMRSLMFSTGFSSIVGLIMLVTGLSSSFVHLMWFLASFMICILILFNMKRKGL